MFYRNNSNFNINITPLIDISFILIIILFQSYHIKNKDMDSLLKESKINIVESTNNIKNFKLEKENILIQVNSKEEIFIENKKYDLNTNTKILEEKLKSLSEKISVYLFFDKNISIQFLFRLYDLISKAKIKNIKILTVKKNTKDTF